MKNLLNAVLLSLSLALVSGPTQADSLTDDITGLQHAWAEVVYQVPEREQPARFEALAQRADQVTTRNGGHAEPLVWQAIILSSYAKAKGGLGALSLVKKARELLLTAEAIDPNALDGSVYSSLGSLYAKVPGWPIGFGDKAQARKYLDKALAINPDGIDPNYFLADLLLDSGDRSGAAARLQKALAAPARPGREDADAGRRADVQRMLDSLQHS